jgi:hypothetical protein
MPMNAKTWKERFKSTPAFWFLWHLKLGLDGLSQGWKWRRSGRTLPPPGFVKRHILRGYARTFGLHTFVETGTHMGDTIFALRRHFDRLFSIELSPDLFRLTRQRFERDPRITILQGDSAEVLPRILQPLSEPCMFWLDGHYSGGPTARGNRESPVVQELECILGHPCKDHVVLIDDARLFQGKNDYPSIQELAALLQSKGPDYRLSISDDIIRIVPAKHRAAGAGLL